MLNKRTNGRTKNYNHCLPFIERMEIEKLIGRDGVIIKENQTQKQKVYGYA